MLPSFGFNSSYTSWILSLTSLDFFLILINGSPSTKFTSSRGIRNRDPLSPFLFILMVEGLSQTIKSMVVNQEIKGLHLHSNDLTQTYQQLVDDTLLMGHSSLRESHTLKKFLNLFMEVFGTTINHDKSQFFFFNASPCLGILWDPINLFWKGVTKEQKNKGIL